MAVNKTSGVIIGLVGLPGSGKTTISDFLTKKGYKIVILSSFIRRELEKKGLLVSRENLQNMGDQLRRQEGPDVLARMASTEIKKNGFKKAVIDGIRNLAEIKKLKQSKNFFLLGVTATPDRRYKRLTKNIDKYNNIQNWEDFIYFEMREDAGAKKQFGQQNRLCFLHADYFIDNNAGYKVLGKKLDSVLDKIKKNI